MAQLHTFIRKGQPIPMPELLPQGIRTTFEHDPYVLAVGSAYRDCVSGNYCGNWQREHGKPSSFMSPIVIDWDQVREHQMATTMVAEGISLAEVVAAEP